MHDKTDQVAFCTAIDDSMNSFESASPAKFQGFFIRTIDSSDNGIQTAHFERKPKYLTYNPSGETFRFLHVYIDHASPADKPIPADRDTNMCALCRVSFILLRDEKSSPKVVRLFDSEFVRQKVERHRIRRNSDHSTPPTSNM
jgi:hypothetical protein